MFFLWSDSPIRLQTFLIVSLISVEISSLLNIVFAFRRSPSLGTNLLGLFAMVPFGILPSP